MDKVKETKLRLNISKNISGQLEGIVKAVVLGGGRSKTSQASSQETHNR